MEKERLLLKKLIFKYPRAPISQRPFIRAQIRRLQEKIQRQRATVKKVSIFVRNAVKHHQHRHPRMLRGRK